MFCHFQPKRILKRYIKNGSLGLSNRLTNMQHTTTLNVSYRHTYHTMRYLYKTETHISDLHFMYMYQTNKSIATKSTMTFNIYFYKLYILIQMQIKIWDKISENIFLYPSTDSALHSLNNSLSRATASSFSM